ASRDASARTREREQSRINSIVLEEVMAALSLAGREPLTAQVRSVASAALASIKNLASAREDAPDYTPVGAISALRSAATDSENRVEFWHRSLGRKDVPADVIEALSEATAEAVRNSIRHGGSED